MRKGKIAFLHGPKDLRIAEVSIPDPGPEQVLVKVGAAGICGSDVECFEGHSKEGRYDLGPYTPGHEWAGEVAAVGRAVTGFAIGDKVTSDCVLNCFKCENCKQGLMPAACLNFREAGFRPDSPGGWGEYLTIEEHYVHKIPPAWTFEEGALVEPFSVGHYGVWGPGGWVDAADDVVVFGGGMIGLCALIVCKAAHANVIVVEPLPNRQEYAKRFGADAVVDPRQVGNLADEIARYTARKRGPTVVVEASGNDSAIASLFDVAGLQPRMRLIGHSVGHKVPVEIGKTIWRGISIYGQGGISYDMPRTITFMDRVRRHADLTQLISHRFPFSRLHDAMETAVLKKAEALKVMLTF